MKNNILGLSVCILVSICLLCGCQNSGSDNSSARSDYVLTEPQVISDENRHLIGKEVNDKNKPEIINEEPTDEEGNKPSSIPENTIVTKVSHGIIVPDSIVIFPCENGETPEVIIPNGGCAIFVPQKNTDGWNCKAGDTLMISFEKYKSDVVDAQKIEIGYVKNGVMFEGDFYDEISGKYKVNVKETGEYALYVMGMASDPITLKTGSVIIQ